MLKLLCCGTGSSGNSYALRTDTETLLLDAGMPIKDIKKMCGWNVRDISGCVVTHEHG
jgi:phosphoribosyl 1,2-cyclic phosphodiesterase